MTPSRTPKACELCGQHNRPEHSTLGHCINALLNRMRTLSYGKVIAIGKSRGINRSSAPTLSGYEHPDQPLEVVEHIYWDERYAGCMGDPDKQTAVIQAARAQLERITHSQADRSKGNGPETWEELRDDLTAKETKGCDPEWVARARQSSRALVIRARLELGLDPQTGWPISGPVTIREIAERAGISKSTAARYYKDAA